MSKRKLEALERRAGFLRARVAGADADGKDLSYDKQELSALLWAIQRLGGGAQWDGTLRIDSDVILNGVLVKAGTTLRYDAAGVIRDE